MLMNRHSLLETIGIYICIALFLTFILLPFAEMFRTSLSPMSHLFRAPYELVDQRVQLPGLSRHVGQDSLAGPLHLELNLYRSRWSRELR